MLARSTRIHLLNSRLLAIALLAAGVLPFAASLPGASRATAADEDRTHLYVSVSGEKRIAAYQVDLAAAKLNPAGGIELDGSPGCLALGRRGSFIYAAIRSTGSVGTLAIDPADGALRLVKSTAAVANPVYLAVDHSGRYLLTAYYSAGRAAVYPIQDDGTVGEESTGVLTTETNPHAILMDAANRTVLVPNTGSDCVLCYRFDAGSGRLEPSDRYRVATAAGAGPRHVAFHPRLPIVYFVNEKNSTVTTYRFDSAGSTIDPLETVPTLPPDFAESNTCADIEVHPSGKFVYASNRGHDSVAVFAVDAKQGTLQPAGHAPTEETPRSFNIDPTGQLMVAAGQKSGRLAIYRIDAESGGLDRSGTLDIGAGPSWVQFVDLAQLSDR